MEALLTQLRKKGVHYINSQNDIILELKASEIQCPGEIDRLIYKLLSEVVEPNKKKLTLQCPPQLLDKMDIVRKMMTVEGKRVIYTRSLADITDIPELSFELWPTAEEQSISFLAETLRRSIQDAKAFLQGMKEELPTQAENMFTVYLVDGEPAGVVLPHIEPKSEREGRIFWIGMHPDYRGKGLGKYLHLIGLHRLQQEFNAKTYLGSTQIDNLPMRNIMASNGCEEQNTVISLKYVSQNP